MQTSRSIQYSLIVLTVIVITSYFLVLTYAYNSYGNELVKIQKKYLEKLPKDSDKIFIIGNSRTLALDPYRIEENIDKEFEVYNLSIGGTGYLERMKVIDLLIESKPKVVILGISGDDFSEEVRKIEFNSEQKNFFPDVKSIINSNLKKISDDIPFLNAPRLYFFSIFTSNYDELKISFSEKENSKIPFFIKSENDYKIIPNNQLKLKNDRIIPTIKSVENNPKLLTFENFIDKLVKNNIKVVIITNPFSKIWIDSTPIERTENFKVILNHLNESNNVKIFDFTERYSNLEIWRDPQHIAFGQSSNVYTDDIIKIIKEEI